jgi:hypothetical protein
MVGAIHIGAMRMMRGLFRCGAAFVGASGRPLACGPGPNTRNRRPLSEAGRGRPPAPPPPGTVRLRRLDLQRSLAGPIHPFPDARGTAEDLLHPEQRRRADGANRLDVLRLGPDPARRRRRLRHLRDHAAAVGMDQGARPARDHLTEQSGRHPTPTSLLLPRTYDRLGPRTRNDRRRRQRRTLRSRCSATRCPQSRPLRSRAAPHSGSRKTFRRRPGCMYSSRSSQASVVLTSRIRLPSREGIRLSVAAQLPTLGGCVQDGDAGLRPRVSASWPIQMLVRSSRSGATVFPPAQWASAFAAAIAVALLYPRMRSLRAGHRPGVSLSRIYLLLPGLLAGAAAGARHGRSPRLRCCA